MEAVAVSEETMQNMRDNGVTVEEPGFEDYFGFDERRKFYLPDGKQYIEFKLMNEGDRSAYQQQTTRDVKLNRINNDATVKMDAAAERKVLIMNSVTGWYMFKKNHETGEWSQETYSSGSGGTFGQWLQRANPKIVSDLEMAIRKANPWMQSEMTPEAIDEEIKNLQELRAEAVKREEGKDAS